MRGLRSRWLGDATSSTFSGGAALGSSEACFSTTFLNLLARWVNAACSLLSVIVQSVGVKVRLNGNYLEDKKMEQKNACLRASRILDGKSR